MALEDLTTTIDHDNNSRPFSERHALAGIALTLVRGGVELMHEDTREIHPLVAIKGLGSTVLDRVMSIAS